MILLELTLFLFVSFYSLFCFLLSLIILNQSTTSSSTDIFTNTTTNRCSYCPVILEFIVSQQVKYCTIAQNGIELYRCTCVIELCIIAVDVVVREWCLEEYQWQGMFPLIISCCCSVIIDFFSVHNSPVLVCLFFFSFRFSILYTSCSCFVFLFVSIFKRTLVILMQMKACLHQIRKI